MLPNYDDYDEETEDEPTSDFEIIEEPSLTYAMHINDEKQEDSIFIGKIDETEAIKQAVLKILNTERYEYEIYSWDYGIEIQDLIGEDIIYVMSELKERITDALTADDRIDSVEDFKVEHIEKRTLRVTFTVVTAQGDELEIEREMEA